MKNLRKNDLFLILTPVLSLLVIAMMQFFAYYLYVNWTPVAYGIAETLLCLSFLPFSLWLAVACGKNKSNAYYVLFMIIGAVLLSIVTVGVPFVLNNMIGKEVYVAAGVGIFVVDICLMVLLGVAIGKLLKFKSRVKIISIVCVSVMVITAGFATAFVEVILDPATDSNNNLYVTQTFDVLGDIGDGQGKEVKVILLGGQSNATGVAYNSCLKATVSEEEYNMYAEGFENVQIHYFTENGNNNSLGFVNVSLGQGFGPAGFGPEVGLGESLSQAFADETVFILKYTWGGSNLHSNWKAPSENEAAGPMYTAFINYVTTNMEYLQAHNYKATIGAMCWMQGESDSDDVNAPLYGERTSALVNSIRHDLASYIAEDGMLFVDAGISDSPYWTNYEIINEQKSALVGVLPQYVYIDTIGAGLDYHKEPTLDSPDLAHYDATSQITLGHLFAEQIIARYGK